MRRPHHGGQNAREWRRKIAALAARKKERVATYKFRLETVTDDIDFAAAARACDVTEGVGRGSLFGLVCAVHLSGFRLFSKGGETAQFRHRSRYPAEKFAAALRAHAGIENSAVTMQSIENALNPPRGRGGVPPFWSTEALRRKLFSAWIGRGSPKDNDPDQQRMSVLADGIAREVVARFGGWQELAADVVGGLACADAHLESLGCSFPKLADLPPITGVNPPNCTFAYDPDSPFVEMTADNEEIWLHQVVAICAGRVKRNASDLEPSSSGFATKLKDAVVTTQNNGLSWLFGVGLNYLRNHDDRAIAKDLRVPKKEHPRVKQLKEFAAAIPPNPFFDTDRYPEFRGSVGGKISSWVSNYWKRICELDDLHARPPQIEIPEALSEDQNAVLFSGQHADAAGLKVLSERMPKQIEEAAAALSVLRGGGIPRREHIENIENVASCVSEFVGQVEMLNNRIQQEMDSAEGPEQSARLQALKIKLPRGFKEPPKLNRISGGAADADSEIRKLESDLNASLRERRNHFRRLADWMEGDGAALDPWPAMVERERKALEDRGMDAGLADEQALRRLLHQIVGMSRRLSPDAASLIREKIAPLFSESREANLCFHNRRGAIYRHPRSASRHQPYRIDIALARESDWWDWLNGLMTQTRERMNRTEGEEIKKDSLRDLLLIEGFVLTERLHGLPDRVPGNLASPRNADGLIHVPPLLRAQLDAEEAPVTRDVALRAFNLFNSTISGLSFRAFRDSFTVRAKFMRLDHEELCYAPKNRPWTPPADYVSAKGDIAKGLALPAVARDDDGAILPCETAHGLSKANFPEPGWRALLRQAPHDWFVEIDLRLGEAPNRAGLPVKKNSSGIKRWRGFKKPAFRLIGPPSFKTRLDQALASNHMKLGDYTLILDRFFEQSWRLQGEEIRLSAHPTRIRAEIAVPVIDDRPYPEATGELLFDNIVAIDLGEKRIGFAVFSLVDLLARGARDPARCEDGKPVVGTVSVPSIRRLMAAVRRHRGSRQPNQKVGQTFSKALMRYRENVMGDVCNRIDTLCARYHAFPVLESSVGNFETGGRQLELIYGSVLRRYTFSGVDAHKAARKHYWNTADSWEHPYIHGRQWNEEEKKRSGRSKPLKIFPGVSVNPAGTSQTCHRCERNAISSLRAMPDKIDVREGGRIDLADGPIKLFKRADYADTQQKEFRRNKQRPPLNVLVSPGRSKREDLVRILRRNQRQPPKSEMSPDTSQARFVCVYEDCDYQGHADENAAINIGLRFLERIDIEASAAARAKLTGAAG